MAMAGMDPFADYLDCDSSLRVIVAQAVAQRAEELRHHELRVLANQIANEVVSRF